MDLYETIRKRKSVRSFLDRPVEDEKIQRILEAAQLAPSARNLQEWRFIVVRDPGLRRRLIPAAAGQSFVGEAPVVIIGCAETDEHIMRCGEKCYPIDLAIAMEHIALAAVAEGLGTCWVGAFYQDQVKMVLEIPDEIKVVELMPLGYPADGAIPEKNRKALEEIIRYDQWQ